MSSQGATGSWSCVLRAYQWRPSVYLHVCEACRPSLPTTHDTSILPSIPSFPLMSHTQPTSTSSNFQLIFDNALKAYKKRTKKDLPTHPLAHQLEACNSPSRILDVLQQQVQELDQSRRRDERWTRWLDPTVKVLHAFSETAGEDVAAVCLSSCTGLRLAPSYLFDRHFHRQKPSLPQSASSS